MITSRKCTARFIPAPSILLAVLFLLCGLHPAAAAQDAKLRLGADRLSEPEYQQKLARRRVALLSNLAGRTGSLRSTVEVLARETGSRLVSVLVPEHGYYGSVSAGAHVDTEFDSALGIPFHSLYGARRRPTKDMLEGVELVVVDLQDLGVRSYTFLSALVNTMDACAQFGVPVWVLDRPNPLGGLVVEGAVQDSGMTSYVGILPVPYIHGMTLGELARMANDEGMLPKDWKGRPRRCDLTVVPMQGWKRGMCWEDTGLLWTPTSPHVPSADAARGMATLGILGDLGILQVGVGTTLPFQYLGMPGLDGASLHERLSGIDEELLASPLRFRPLYGKFVGKDCGGLLLRYKRDAYFRPYNSFIEILIALRQIEPALFRQHVEAANLSMLAKVVGSERFWQDISASSSPGNDDTLRNWVTKGVGEFERIRSRYLLY